MAERHASKDDEGGSPTGTVAPCRTSSRVLTSWPPLSRSGAFLRATAVAQCCAGSEIASVWQGLPGMATVPKMAGGSRNSRGKKNDFRESGTSFRTFAIVVYYFLLLFARTFLKMVAAGHWGCLNGHFHVVPLALKNICHCCHHTCTCFFSGQKLC